MVHDPEVSIQEHKGFRERKRETKSERKIRKTKQNTMEEWQRADIRNNNRDTKKQTSLHSRKVYHNHRDDRTKQNNLRARGGGGTEEAQHISPAL